MAQNLNRPPSGIGSAGNTAGPCGNETQTVGHTHTCETDSKCTGVDGLDEGSIRQDQTGYAGS